MLRGNMILDILHTITQYACVEIQTEPKTEQAAQVACYTVYVYDITDWFNIKS